MKRDRLENENVRRSALPWSWLTTSRSLPDDIEFLKFRCEPQERGRGKGKGKDGPQIVSVAVIPLFPIGHMATVSMSILGRRPDHESIVPGISQR